MKLSAKKPLRNLIGFCFVVVGLSLPLGANIILTTDRSLFLNSNPISSTETFDEFSHPTQFPLANQSVTIDFITYVDPTPTPNRRSGQISITSSPLKTVILVSAGCPPILEISKPIQKGV